MLDIRLKSSNYLVLWLGAAHAIAAGLFVILPLPVVSKLIAVLVLGLSLIIYLRRNAWLASPNSIIALEIKEDCACAISTRRGQRLDCILLPTSYVSAPLTVLNLKADGERRARHVVLFPDAINYEDYRKLRVLLRWKFKAKPFVPIA